MKTKKYIRIFVFSMICISLFFCKKEEVILHSDLTGIVTDTLTSEPIQEAGVKLSPSNDTTSTGSDGTYLFSNITPGEYEIEVSKIGYDTISTNVYVHEAKTNTANFALEGIPFIDISVKSLDFMMDLTVLSFNISNIGIGTLHYNVISSQDWIIVDPISGDVTDETDHITVTIDKTGLSDSIYKETIEIISGVSTDTIDVYLNGLMDIDLNYYQVVTIGTQTWMAENLKTTRYRNGDPIRIVTEDLYWSSLSTQAYCNYDNDPNNSTTYGRLYNWYAVNDDRKIAPTGWHVPTDAEWTTLENYLIANGYNFDGTTIGNYIAKALASDMGWTSSSDPGAIGNTDYPTYRNKSGFAALPGGARDWNGVFEDIGYGGYWWSSTYFTYVPDGSTHTAYFRGLYYSGWGVWWNTYYKEFGFSVRCVKDN